jgi:phage terminase large subunit GpA-like protein
MDACCDPAIHTIVVMKSAQVGYTECLLNVLGYYISQDPSPILLVNPTLEMSEVFSKTRLAPMLRDSPCLQGLVADPRSRDSGNTLLSKNFPGGVLALAGANSPAGLASRPIRIVLCDEVDRFPASAGPEGDPVNLAIKRSATFQNRKIIIGSTPTIKGLSRIEQAYEASDRRRYYVPCPHCRHYHPLQWANLHFDAHHPENAAMACPECGGLIEEKHKTGLLARGEWRSEQPGVQGMAGFHLNELYSPWRRWADVVRDFLAAKAHPETLKTWINTSLGETWEEESEKSDPTSLLARRENYTEARLPAGILYVTVGVDVQGDRLEAEAVGWRQTARDQPPESWGIAYQVFHGDPGTTTPWIDLDHWLKQEWTAQDGRKLRVSAACVDTGGHHAAQVYAFCASRQGRHIYAIKGSPGSRPIWTPKARKATKYNAQVWLVGVDTAKDAWYARLRTPEPGPGYCHFPTAYSEHYFEMLTAEQVRTKFIKGRPQREWFCPSGRRNEALDIRVYALAALLARPIDWASLSRSSGPPVEAPRAAPREAPASSFINRPSGSPWIRR